VSPRKLKVSDLPPGACARGIEHPVHLLPQDTDRERVQRIMRAAPGSKPVREAEEVRLEDNVEHLDDGTLDDLVLQSRNAQWPLASVRLRNVHPPRRSWSVCSLVHPRVQRSEVVLELLAVVLPCHTVDAGSGMPLQCEECRAEPGDVDVVEERGEPCPSRFARGDMAHHVPDTFRPRDDYRDLTFT
jgi:hypothetical protein